MTRAPIMVMAGGTGGHVFPALAVAERLTASGWPVVWLGTRHGIEARLVPAAGFEVEWIEVRALRGTGAVGWIFAPFRVVYALVRSLVAMLERKPAAVLGMGGYVTGPGGVAAWLLRRPLLVHEQNAVAGLTNRALARLARRVLTGFPGTLRQGEWIGNPVRAAIAALASPRERMADRDGPLRVLVLGGSQGARAINEVIPAAVARLAPAARPLVRHQCGERLLEETRTAWRAAGVAVEPVAFIEDMAEAYAWADLVVCRAGALTCAELAAAGVASILVPFPAAVDDHQTRNARFLADAGAAELVPQSAFDATCLAERFVRYASRRTMLEHMGQAARSLARPGAADDLARACMDVAEGTE